MIRFRRAAGALIAAVSFAASVGAQGQPPRQTQADDYTRYELLEPGSGKFRILYEVTATTAGATQFFNAIRTGSVASDESVFDRATGKPLRFDEVGVDVARTGGVRGGDSLQKYIRVFLARPVPLDGEARILIDKTYLDTLSYYQQGSEIVFTRALGIKRNAVVLPRGYELVSSNYPAQVIQQSDGRVAIAFWNNTPAAADLTLRARRWSGPAPRFAAVSPGVPSAPADRGPRLDERARQNREIVYSLRDPDTHAFDLYHDYTESRAGVGTYLNIVRAGSTVAGPRARNLDTGADLTSEILKGAAITAAKLDVPNVTPGTEVVVFRFPAVPEGGSTRIRMYETYTDTARYKVVNGELVWDRAFGRPTNAVILPAGWTLTNSSIPTVVTETADGRTRLDFVNPRTDEIAVLITARRK